MAEPPATSGVRDALPSWNEGPAKAAILGFVAAVTTPGSPDFLPEPERVAVFDNDGTLWVEQPFYTQLAFAIDRVKALAPSHPKWRDEQPFKAALDGDFAALAAQGLKGVMSLAGATHAGCTSDEFAAVAAEWIGAARHPRFKRPYTELVYQPMLEVLALLRASGFQNWIVTGGGVEFVRAFAERVYGIPPERVVGSSISVEYSVRDGQPVLVRKPQIGFINDGPGKPVAINLHVGRQPIAAFGNSDGDFEMLHWTTAGPAPGGATGGRRLGLIVHHTDAAREYAYDRESAAGKLSRALDGAPGAGWVVADVARDWRVVFPWEV